MLSEDLLELDFSLSEDLLELDFSLSEDPLELDFPLDAVATVVFRDVAPPASRAPSGMVSVRPPWVTDSPVGE